MEIHNFSPYKYRLQMLSFKLKKKNSAEQTCGQILGGFAVKGQKRGRNLKGVFHKVRTYKEYHSVCPSSELGLSQPLSRQRVFPSPQTQGGGGTLACGWGVGGSPNSDEGPTLWYSLYVRTLWDLQFSKLFKMTICKGMCTILHIKVHRKTCHPFTLLHLLHKFVLHTEFKGSPECTVKYIF